MFKHDIICALSYKSFGGACQRFLVSTALLKTGVTITPFPNLKKSQPVELQLWSKQILHVSEICYKVTGQIDFQYWDNNHTCVAPRLGVESQQRRL